MRKKSKRSKLIQEKVEHEKVYDLTEAINLLKEIKATKFDESVEVALRLGVDTRKADQMVRGTCLMPNGLGKEIRLLVFAKGDKAIVPQEAGADSGVYFIADFKVSTLAQIPHKTSTSRTTSTAINFCFGICPNVR